MRPVVFCYAPADGAVARTAAEYLETNLPFRAHFNEGLIGPECDLLEAVRRSLWADLVVVLLSPDAVPGRWDRPKWEPVLIQHEQESCLIVYLLARERRFPDLLRRQAFFDMSGPVLPALRAMKRRVLSHGRLVHRSKLPPVVASPAHDLSELESLLADRPGFAMDIPSDTAAAFARMVQDDFEGVMWIDGSHRSGAGVIGDTAHALGLRLTGTVERNAAAIRELCLERRCLFVYDRLSAGEDGIVGFGGRSSVLVTSTRSPRPLRGVNETAGVFARWAADPETCLGYLGDARAHIEAGGSPRLGPAVVAVLKHYERLAEAEEVLRILLPRAEAGGREDSVHKLTWDLTWIHGHWGEPYGAPVPGIAAPSGGAQLGFNF